MLRLSLSAYQCKVARDYLDVFDLDVVLNGEMSLQFDLYKFSHDGWSKCNLHEKHNEEDLMTAPDGSSLDVHSHMAAFSWTIWVKVGCHITS